MVRSSYQGNYLLACTQCVIFFKLWVEKKTQGEVFWLFCASLLAVISWDFHDLLLCRHSKVHAVIFGVWLQRNLHFQKLCPSQTDEESCEDSLHKNKNTQIHDATAKCWGASNCRVNAPELKEEVQAVWRDDAMCCFNTSKGRAVLCHHTMHILRFQSLTKLTSRCGDTRYMRIRFLEKEIISSRSQITKQQEFKVPYD